MLQPNRESLEVTINKIKKNEILLPDFQRQFVWKEEEMQHIVRFGSAWTAGIFSAHSCGRCCAPATTEILQS